MDVVDHRLSLFSEVRLAEVVAGNFGSANDLRLKRILTSLAHHLHDSSRTSSSPRTSGPPPSTS